MLKKLQFIRIAAFAVAIVASVALPTRTLLAQATADTILHNGKILTVDSKFSTAEAVAIAGDKIVAVGNDNDIMKLAKPNALVIDLKGRTVIPGLIDSHRHSYAYAEGTYGGLFTEAQLHRFAIDWRGVRDKDDVLNLIKGIMAQNKFKPGQWIYFVNQLQFFTRDGGTKEQAKILYDDLNQWELDKVTPNNPVLLSLGIPDFNGFLANKQAVDILWKEHGDFIKKNGRFWIDASGRPDGHIEPPASRLALPYTYDRPPDILATMYAKQIEEESSMGLTQVTGRLPEESIAAYKLLESKGELNQREGFGMIEPFGNVTDLKTGLKKYAAQIGKGDDMIWATGAGPTAVDGSTSRACTNQKRTGEYSAIDSWFPTGQCHMDIEYRGAVNRSAPMSTNYFKNYVMASGRDGLRFANVHVAGDRAVGLLASTVDEIQKQYGPNATKNWALDHCDMVDPKDFARLARLKIVMSCYVYTSIRGSAAINEAYGEKVANTFPSPLKSMVDAGVRVVLESDSNSYIWQDFAAAITRKDRTGKVWAPQERVDRPTALRMFTSWAADYVLRPDKIGTIEPGKYADLVVLDKDYLTVPDDEIASITPQVTMVGGRIVFVHSQFAQEYNLKPKGAVISTYKELIARRKPRTSFGAGG